jgi:hypothetical protein
LQRSTAFLILLVLFLVIDLARLEYAEEREQSFVFGMMRSIGSFVAGIGSDESSSRQTTSSEFLEPPQYILICEPASKDLLRPLSTPNLEPETVRSIKRHQRHYDKMEALVQQQINDPESKTNKLVRKGAFVIIQYESTWQKENFTVRYVTRISKQKCSNTHHIRRVNLPAPLGPPE